MSNDSNKEDNIKSADEYREGWDSTNWDIVSDKPDVSKRNHASGHPLRSSDDKNEIEKNDDSGSTQQELGGTTADNRGNAPKP